MRRQRQQPVSRAATLLHFRALEDVPAPKGKAYTRARIVSLASRELILSKADKDKKYDAPALVMTTTRLENLGIFQSGEGSQGILSWPHVHLDEERTRFNYSVERRKRLGEWDDVKPLQLRLQGYSFEKTIAFGTYNGECWMLCRHCDDRAAGACGVRLCKSHPSDKWLLLWSDHRATGKA
jgi:hypothetical protein